MSSGESGLPDIERIPLSLVVNGILSMSGSGGADRVRGSNKLGRFPYLN